jgi:GTP-binding protein LepA
MGFITAAIKTISDTKVGDTITDERNQAKEALPGFKPSIPMVFCSLFPADASNFEHLRDSLGKLALNDASLHYEPESSQALGLGFRCGFLGLLHMEIIQERLQREFNLDLIPTAPSVVYKIHMTNGETIELYNPVDMPDVVRIKSIEEPIIKATILVPDEYLGGLLQLCEERRGEQIELTYAGNRAMLVYRLPLNEVVFDFYDRLKSISRGYASFDYHLDGFREDDLVKMDILVNQEPVDALAMIVHKSQAERRGRQLCERLKDLIPRQLIKVAIQAAIGGKIIAREDIGALKKDVLAKCYGGDITRKRKLLDKQKEGKKKMQQYGSVDIPQTAFIEALRMGNDK